MQETRKALITGADGGLGKVVTAKLLGSGWHLHACVHSTAAGEHLRQNFPEQNGTALTTFEGDITDKKSVEAFVAGAGSFSALVHLAGGFRPAGELAKTPDEDFDFLMNLNLRSTFLLLRAAMPLLRSQKGGAMVTIGAKPAVRPSKENAVYNASKAGVISLALTAAEEGRADGVRSNVIVPAVIRTEANRKWAASEKEVERWTPPKDIAEAIVFLLSDAAKGITGTVIPMYNKLT